MTAPAPLLRRLALLVLALLTLLGDGAFHRGHHGLRVHGGADGTELHDGSCDHLPPMVAEGRHDCLLCQAGPNWLLATTARARSAVTVVDASRRLAPRAEPARAPVGSILGPRGPPAIG